MSLKKELMFITLLLTARAPLLVKYGLGGFNASLT